MNEFRSYGKIHRLGKEEPDGILMGVCFVSEKLDGANTSAWLDENGEMKLASRTRVLGEEEFNGFVPYMKGHEGVKRLLANHPTWRLYGEWLCLSGDTIIKKVSGGRGGNGNYMTLRQMYQYLNKTEKGRNVSWWARYGMPSIYSLHPDKDKVLPNKIKRIEYTGDKEVYEIKTREGFKLKATKEHPILTQDGFVEIGKLDVKNHVVAVTSLRATRESVRNLGVGSNKMLKEQKAFVNDGGACLRCSSVGSLELDHIDEDWTNNNKSNWQVLCSGCHRIKSGNSQKKRRAHSKGYSYRFDKISSIDLVGVEDTYDVEMEGPPELANFVANNFIVHNCRHTIAYKETAYKKWYMFDIWTTEGYVLQNGIRSIGEEYGIATVPYHKAFVDPTVEQIMEYVGKSEFGDRGEGVVIKNLDFVNKFGDVVFAKIVTESFKEDNAVTFGGNNKHSDTYYEVYVVNKYMTLPRVKKIMDKLQPIIPEKLDMKHIPWICGTAFHDMMTEEIGSIVKDVPKLDFKALQRIAFKKAKQIFVDILNDSISVADRKN